MCLLVKYISYRIYTYFCQNRPFRTGFFPQVHTRMSLHQNYFENLDTMATITNIWPYATDTASKKNNKQTYSQSQQHLLRNMHFFYFFPFTLTSMRQTDKLTSMQTLHKGDNLCTNGCVTC